MSVTLDIVRGTNELRFGLRLRGIGAAQEVTVVQGLKNRNANACVYFPDPRRTTILGLAFHTADIPLKTVHGILRELINLTRLPEVRVDKETLTPYRQR